MTALEVSPPRHRHPIPVQDEEDMAHHSRSSSAESSGSNAVLDKELGESSMIEMVDTTTESLSLLKEGLPLRPVGTASPKQVAANIVISFVGAGMLGMPYAFSQAGWLLGPLALAAVSAANVYAMLLLVKTRNKLQSQNKVILEGYGDVGGAIMGERGKVVVNLCLVLSQAGFATAYLIFIAANITSIFQRVDRIYVCLGSIPILAMIIQARDMKTLSPFSLTADMANACGLMAVFLEDVEYYEQDEKLPIVACVWSQLVYVMSISIYSLEGVGLILSLESSCAKPEGFPLLLKRVVCGITAFMAFFGVAGYMAFGSATLAPVTLNLQQGGWVAAFVKLMLCLALYLTYPVMMFPVHQVTEDLWSSLENQKVRVAFRASIVVLTAVVAYAVPDFGKFLSLVGSSICTILGFIFPCYFHLKVFWEDGLATWQIMLDVILIVGGIAFGALGTYDSFMTLIEGGDGIEV